MIKIGIEAITGEQKLAIVHGKVPQPTWSERKSRLLEQELSVEEVEARLGLELKVEEIGQGLTATVDAGRVLNGVLYANDEYGSMLRVKSPSLNAHDGILEVSAAPGEYIKFNCSESFGSPDQTSLYIFPNLAADFKQDSD